MWPLISAIAKRVGGRRPRNAGGYPADVQSVEMLQRIMPIELVPIEAPGHAFIPFLSTQQGKVRALYDRLFGSESGQASAERRSRADQVA